NRRKWQRSTVEQLFRKMQSARVKHIVWRCAYVLDEQTVQMSRSDAEARRQGFHSQTVEAVLVDQSETARYRSRCALPGRRSRRNLGMAAKAGPEPGSGCASGCREVPHVPLQRAGRRTDRPAIDAG